MSDVYTVIVKIRLCNIASIINGCILLKEKKLPESRSIVVNLSWIIRLAKTLFWRSHMQKHSRIQKHHNNEFYIYSAYN